jgi:hypothetical protein
VSVLRDFGTKCTSTFGICDGCFLIFKCRKSVHTKILVRVIVVRVGQILLYVPSLLLSSSLVPVPVLRRNLLVALISLQKIEI